MHTYFPDVDSSRCLIRPSGRYLRRIRTDTRCYARLSSATKPSITHRRTDRQTPLSAFDAGHEHRERPGSWSQRLTDTRARRCTSWQLAQRVPLAKPLEVKCWRIPRSEILRRCSIGHMARQPLVHEDHTGPRQLGLPLNNPEGGWVGWVGWWWSPRP
jgi:hypothetical protein